MSKTIAYRQCQLRKKHADGSASCTVSFIPEPYCIKNKVLKLRDKDGKWDNGWVVESAGARQVDILDAHDAIKQHRKNTGDSMPK